MKPAEAATILRCDLSPLSIDDDADKANQRLDEFLESFHNIGCNFGSSSGLRRVRRKRCLAESLCRRRCHHIVIRFAGDDNNLEIRYDAIRWLVIRF